ncbi:AraD1 family protein [Mesorhizobium sp. 10J20-29]
MLISQIVDGSDMIQVVARTDSGTRVVNGAKSVYSLALEAARAGVGLVELIERKGFGKTVDLEAAYRQGRLISPINHPDAAHLHLTGTGLTHLGSAATRDSMHKKLSADGDEALTDSMKMFQMGLEGGKPANGKPGVQPEWFYKGNGFMAVAPGAPLMSPDFAMDAGEEPEIAGIYVIGDDGTPFRVGFALSNEFSDHVTERVNYLYLAHSKLRNASFGPEILVGALPEDIRGTSRITRGGETMWEKPFLSGEANMSHTIANLEHHHFKYPVFRQPGDVHIHMFGTATLSFADGVKAEEGDVFEIAADQFGLPLRNPLHAEPAKPVTVRAL